MKKILYSAMAIAAMSACSKGGDTIAPIMDNQVRISSSIVTRTSGNAWESGDAIGLYMNETEGTLGALATNKKYTTALGDGIFDTDEKLFYPPTTNVDFLAYYPYSEDTDFDATAYMLDLTNQDDESTIDLLSAKLVDQAKTPEAVELEFDHKLSRVVISAISAGDGIEAADLAGAKVYLDGVATKGSFDFTTDAVSSLETTTQLYFKMSSASTSASAIVIPQTLTDVILKIETAKLGTFETAIKTAEYKSGQEYSYTVRINRTGATISGATINPWGAGNDGDDMDATLPDIDIKFVDNYYQIYSAKGLTEFVAKVNDNGSSLNGKLMTNINLAGVDSEGNGIEGKEFTPINSYSAIFDGNGFEISGLYIVKPNNSAYGFICTIGSDGVIKNLGISGLIQGGNRYSGTFAGENYGRIFNCYSTATVMGSDTGGLVGDNQSTIENCYFAGKCDMGEAITKGVERYQSIINCYFAEGSAMSCDNGGEEKTVAEMQSRCFAYDMNDRAADLNTDTEIACGWRWNRGAYPTLDSGNYPKHMSYE